MHLRNGPHGYGVVAKVLHWLTVLLLLVQVPLGFSMDWDDSGKHSSKGSGHDFARELARADDAEEWREVREDMREERAEQEDADSLVPFHVAFGLTILLVGLTRIGWRLATPLPPWAEQLTPRDRVLATWTERALLTSLLLMPATGLALIRSGDDDLLPLHLASHALLYAAVALHVGLVLRRRTLRRMLA